jgi:hypothetical protein
MEAIQAAHQFLTEIGLNYDGIEVVFVKHPRQTVHRLGVHVVDPTGAELAHAVCTALDHDFDMVYVYSKHSIIEI